METNADEEEEEGAEDSMATTEAQFVMKKWYIRSWLGTAASSFAPTLAHWSQEQRSCPSGRLSNKVFAQ